MANKDKTNPNLPKSPTSMPINIIGVSVAVLTFIIIKRCDLHFCPVHGGMTLLLAYAAPVILLEYIFLRTFKRTSTGLDFSIRRKFDIERVIIKLLGFYATLILIAFVYWLLHEYRGSFYDNYKEFLKTLMPWLIGGAIPYFIIVDYFMISPKDGYWNMGMFVLGQWSVVNRKELGQHLLAWLVKLFFLPLMFIYFTRNLDSLWNWNFDLVFRDFKEFFLFSRHLLFTSDLLLATTGYILALRIFDSHVRSAEPTLFGWLVTLECYEPFWSFSSNLYIQYSNGYDWWDWLDMHSVIYAVWGSIVLLLLFCYVFSTLSFGIRFSNVTNRGILTNGLYRFTKHPAYVSKNIVWWFISIPFIPNQGVPKAIRLCLLLLCVNFFYFLRARTEERHLSKDPNYVKYATIMNERSIFAWVGKLFPIIKYKPHRLFNIKKQNE